MRLGQSQVGPKPANQLEHDRIDRSPFESFGGGAALAPGCPPRGAMATPVWSVDLMPYDASQFAESSQGKHALQPARGCRARTGRPMASPCV